MNDSGLKDLSSGDENEDNRGVDLSKVPQVNGCNIDLCALYRLVTKNGGYKKINRHSQWSNIQQLLRLPVRAMDPNEGQMISQIFHDYLRLFYDHLKRHQSPTLKAPRTRHVESTASIHRRPRRPLQPRVETQRNRGRGSSRRVASSEAIWSELSLAPNSTISGSAELASRAFDTSRLTSITPAVIGEHSSQSIERGRKRRANRRRYLETEPRSSSAVSEDAFFSASSLDRPVSKRTAVEDMDNDISNTPYTSRRTQSVMSESEKARKRRDEWVALRLIVAKDVSHPTRRASIAGIVRHVSGPLLVGEISSTPSRAITDEHEMDALASTVGQADFEQIPQAYRSRTPMPIPRYHSDKPYCFYEGDMDDSNDSFASNNPDQHRVWSYETIKAHTALESGQTSGEKPVLEQSESEVVPDSRRESSFGDACNVTACETESENSAQPADVTFVDMAVQTSVDSQHRGVATSPIEGVAEGVQANVGLNSRTTQTEVSAAMDPCNSVRIATIDAEMSNRADSHSAPSERHSPCFYCSPTVPFGMSPFMYGPQPMGGLTSLGAQWFGSPYYQNVGLLQPDELQRHSAHLSFASSTTLPRSIAEACSPLMFPSHPSAHIYFDAEMRPGLANRHLSSTTSSFTSMTELGCGITRPIRHFVPPRVAVPARPRRERPARSSIPRAMASVHHTPRSSGPSVRPAMRSNRPQGMRPGHMPGLVPHGPRSSAPFGEIPATSSSDSADIKPVVSTLEASQGLVSTATDTVRSVGNQNISSVGLSPSVVYARPSRESTRPLGLLTETQDSASLSMSDIVRISRVPRILIDEHVSNDDILSVFPPTVTDAAMYGFTPLQSLNISCLNNPVVLDPENQRARDDLLGISNGTFNGVVTSDERFSVPVHPRNQLYQVVDHINVLLGRLRLIARIAQQETTRSDPSPTSGD